MQMHARQDSHPFPPCQRVGKCARESTAGGILFGDKAAAAAGSRCRMALAVPHRAQEKLAYQRGHRWPYRENVCNQNHKTVEVVPFYLCFFFIARCPQHMLPPRLGRVRLQGKADKWGRGKRALPRCSSMHSRAPSPVHPGCTDGLIINRE